MNSLHDKILNIPFINRVFNKKEEKTAYRIGHHDAVLAAAALCSDADDLIYDLISALESALKNVEFERQAYRPWHDKAKNALSKAKGES